MSKDDTYQLTVNEAQLHLITSSLEQRMRFDIGQVDNVFSDIWWLTDKLTSKEIDDVTKVVKETLFPEFSRHESRGVHKTSTKISKLVRELYEIRSEIMYRYNLYHGIDNVLTYPVDKVSDNPLIKLKKL